MSESDEDSKVTKSTIDLIEAVQKWPCIYDVKHEYYRNILARKEAWHEIGVELQTENVEPLQMKWRNLKDRYIRLEPGAPKRKYRWAPHLKFLDNVTRTPKKKIRRVHKQKHYDVSVKAEVEEVNLERTIDIFPQPNQLYMENNSLSQDFNYQNKDDIFFLFLSYGETFRKFTPKRQAKLKLEFAKLFSIAELEQLDDAEF